MLPKNWILSAVILLIALIGVFYIKSQMSENGAKEPVEIVQQADWCEGTVDAISLPSQLKISRAGDNWLLDGTPAPKLKEWFEKYCVIQFDRVTRADSSSMLSPLLKIEHRMGKKDQLFQIDPTGLFEWKGLLFQSKQFDSALTELRQIRSELEAKKSAN